MEAIFASNDFSDVSKSALRFVVLKMGELDAPRMMRHLAEARGRIDANGNLYDP